MKTTNRIRQNGSTKTVKPQAQNPPAKSVTVVFLNDDDDYRELFHVDLPELIWAAIMCACKKTGIKHSQFFEQAIREKMSCPDNMTRLRKLDNVAHEVSALFTLINDHRNAAHDKTVHDDP